MSVPSVPIVDLTYAQMADEVRALASRHPSLALAFTAQERYSLPAAAGYPVWILELCWSSVYKNSKKEDTLSGWRLELQFST